MSLCFADQLSDKYVLRQIILVTSLCLRLCCVAKQFAEESVLQRISSLTSLCFSESVR